MKFWQSYCKTKTVQFFVLHGTTMTTLTLSNCCLTLITDHGHPTYSRVCCAVDLDSSR